VDKPIGGQVNYYLALLERRRRPDQQPCVVECEEIIEALKLTFDEACEFKAIWRTAAARLGTPKPGTNPLEQAVYDAEKRVHYANQSLLTEKFKFNKTKPDPILTPEEAMVQLNRVPLVEPKKDVWHPYDGTGLGGRGLNLDTYVYCRLAGSPDLASGPYPVRDWIWTWYHGGKAGGDIIAYRFD